MEQPSGNGDAAAPRHHVAASAREVAERASALTRLELELAQLELKRKASELAVGSALAAGAAVLAAYAVAFLLAAAAAGIATTLPWWAALLIVGGRPLARRRGMPARGAGAVQEGDASRPSAGDPAGPADTGGDQPLMASPRTPETVTSEIEREREQLVQAVSTFRTDLRAATNIRTILRTKWPQIAGAAVVVSGALATGSCSCGRRASRALPCWHASVGSRSSSATATTDYARSSAPNRSASAATILSRRLVACSSESVPSVDW